MTEAKTNTLAPKNRSGMFQGERGFALVVTLSLMVLLTLVAVGLLGISSIALRSGNQGAAIAEARANARLALMLAIGELQNSAGPDRAITATSEIMAPTPAKPNTAGVWESWWDFNPNAAPNYTAEKTSRFRRWLVSSTDMVGVRTPGFANNAWTGKTVELVGKGSIGSTAAATAKVTAGLVPVSRNGKVQGSYGWHVADESVKARINLYRDPAQNTTLAQKRALLAGHRPDPSLVKGPDGSLLTCLPTDLNVADFNKAKTTSGKIIDLDQAELLDLAKGKIKPLRNDITPFSMGVLTDVRGGGLKQDLSSVFEMSAASNRLPAEFDSKTLYQSTLGITGESDPKWSALASYYNSYKNLTSTETSPAYVPKPGASYLDAVPSTYNPAPVIAKVDTIFSLVGRPLTDVAWVDKTKYDFFIDLIYTPVVTLHNPYNVSISFQKLQITFSNLPIAFNFMMQPGGSGSFISKSVIPGTFESLNTMYQIQTYRGEKKFVVNIANWADEQPLKVSDAVASPIVMKPGQTLICGPSMPANSSFYKDSRAGYNGDAYNWHEDDSRGTGKITEKIKAKTSFTPGIGFETTAVMIANTRPAMAMGSWCSYFMLRDQAANPKVSGSTATDRFYVEFQAQRPYFYPEDLSKSAATLRTTDNAPSFAVTAQLQATASDPMVDFAKLQFDYNDDATLKNVFNDRVYRYPPVGSLTATQAAAPGGEPYGSQSSYVHPFAIISAYTRTTNGGVYETGKRTKSAIDSPQVNLLRDGRLAGKPFLFHNPSKTNFTIKLASEKPGLQPCELNFQPFLSKGDYEGYMEVDAASRVPALSGNRTTTGIKSGSYLELPSGPLQAIADFRRSNALTTSYQPYYVQPVANSLLHPLMSPGKVVETDASISSSPLLDHSVLANHSFYDRFYFSTFATRGATKPDAVFEQFMSGTTPLASQIFQPYLPGSKSVVTAKDELFATGVPKDTAYKTAAEYQMVRGPFNVNSTSVQAWKAVLASMNKSDVSILALRAAGLETRTTIGTPFFPMSLINGGKVVPGVLLNESDRSNNWSGYRELTEPELEKLATSIVAEVRDRGPFLSLSEFVNRQVGSTGPRTLSGALETAIAKAEINEKQNATFPDTFLNQVPITAPDLADAKLYNYKTPEATTGNPAAGAPGWVCQGDLMRILEPAATVRGDTFVIRSYGEAQDINGNITARAWAEAVVQRMPEYVDPSDRPSLNVFNDPTAKTANKTFGRRFKVVSFRWLTKEEV